MAWKKLKIWLTPFLAVLILLFTLGSFLIKTDLANKAKEQLLANPDNPEAHLALAEEFLTNNQFSQAEKELRWLQKQANNLTAEQQAQLHWLWQKRNYTDPTAIRESIFTWEKIVQEKPNYRDAWLQLAFLHYLLKEDRQALSTLERVLEIDPLYELSLKLKRALEE